MRRAIRLGGSAALLLAVLAPSARAQEPFEVPLRVVGDRLVVTVEVEPGHGLPFLLSTTSPVTVVTEMVAAHLGDVDPTLAGAPLDTDDVHTVPDGALDVGGERILGVVGASTLSAYDLLIDAPNERVLLRPVGPRVSWPGVALSDPVRLRIYHGVAIGLDAWVDGERLPAALDLGTVGILVNEAARQKVGAEAGAEVSLRIGSSTIPGVRLAVGDNELLARWDQTGSGFALVGTALTRDCVLALSWAHSELRTCRR